ncbi:MAG: hypothetical protein FJX72_21435 [Armatimonadetes bacterium]|nr:hypothetical protein [Armatimonadota bacterium]
MGARLAEKGIRAVLTGGACVSIYTGTYVSRYADFVLQSVVSQRDLDEALGELGFIRTGAGVKEGVSHSPHGLPSIHHHRAR